MHKIATSIVIIFMTVALPLAAHAEQPVIGYGLYSQRVSDFWDRLGARNYPANIEISVQQTADNAVGRGVIRMTITELSSPKGNLFRGIIRTYGPVEVGMAGRLLVQFPYSTKKVGIWALGPGMIGVSYGGDKSGNQQFEASVAIVTEAKTNTRN